MKIKVNKYNEIFSGSIQKLLDNGAEINKDPWVNGVCVGRFNYRGDCRYRIFSGDDVVYNGVVYHAAFAKADYFDREIEV